MTTPLVNENFLPALAGLRAWLRAARCELPGATLLQEVETWFSLLHAQDKPALRAHFEHLNRAVRTRPPTATGAVLAELLAKIATDSRRHPLYELHVVARILERIAEGDGPAAHQRMLQWIEDVESFQKDA